MARKPSFWLTECCVVGLFARGAVGQDGSAAAVHGLTVTGCFEQAQRAVVVTSAIDDSPVRATTFRLTHAATVTPDADRRTGFSSPKTSTPSPGQTISNEPDQYRLTVDPERAGRHLNQTVSVIGTLDGSQLRVRRIRTISLTCS